MPYTILLAFEDGEETGHSEEGEGADTHATEEQAANPILPTVPETFWGALTFAALFLLIKFVLLPPVRKTTNDRANQVRADLDAADWATASAGSAEREAGDQLADVRAEASAVVDQARAEAEAERSEIMAAAEAEAAQERAAADAEIETARAEAMVQVRPQVAVLAANAASRVIQRDVSASAAQPIVDRYLDNPN